MKSKLTVYSAAVIAMLFWGLSFVWVKIVYEYMTPISTVCSRLVLASILMLILIKLLKKEEEVAKSDRKWFLLLAFFEPFCYFLGESFGMLYVTSTVASIMISTIPVVAPFFARFFMHEKISAANFAGLILSFIGVLMVVLDRNLSFQAEPIGLILMLFAVFSGAFYGLVLKKLSHGYSTYTVVKWQNILGLIYFLPLFLIFEIPSFSAVHWDFRLISTIGLLAVFPSTLSFLLLTNVFRQLGINKTNIFTNLIPVFTAIFAFLLLGEQFDLIKIVGIAVIISGILLAQFSGLISGMLKNKV